MILFIDTSDFNNLHLALVPEDSLSKSSRIHEFKASVAFNENYKTNEFVEKFLKSKEVVPKDLTKVVVCSGPGSFTGIRVGVSLAQALGFALKIPVVTVPKNKVANDLRKLIKLKSAASKELNYGQKPNITKAKKI